MNSITVLLLAVGAAVGALLVLWADGVYWGKRLQTTVLQQQKLKAQLLELQKRLARRERDLRQVQQALVAKTRQAEQLSAECVQLNGNWQTAVADLQVARDNLVRVNDYADELQAGNDEWVEKYRAAEEALAIERAQLKEVMGELTAVKSENEHVRQTVLSVSSKMKAFGGLQEKARHQEEMLARLREEKLAVVTALRHAESQAHSSGETARHLQESLAALRQQQREQAEALAAARKLGQEQGEKLVAWRQRVQEGEEGKRRLTAVSQELAAARVEIETLQSQLRDHTYVQKTILQQGDSLTLVNGIGPRYAQRLKEAGIVSLTQLAHSSANDIRVALQLQEWQGRNIQGWIDEAKELVNSVAPKI